MRLRHKTNNRDSTIWHSRYGHLAKYKDMCKSAHKETHNLCCVCLNNKSTQIHHACYGNDIIGKSIFPVCVYCHYRICHHKFHWIRCPTDPVWNNRNTEDFTQKLQSGYESLVNETAPILQRRKKIELYQKIILDHLKALTYFKMVITLQEASRVSGLSINFLKEQIKLGNLNAKKIEQKWMMRPNDIHNLLDSLFQS